MHFWIVQTGEPIFTDGQNVRPMRAMNLTSKLIESGHKVTLITSNFDHFGKRKRFSGDELVRFSDLIDIYFVDSPGYRRNISLSRFIDHYIMGRRMKKTTGKIAVPDAVFLGYPPIETSWSMAKFCKSAGIPYILDVKDAWPSNIVEIFPTFIKPLIKLIMFPYFKMFKFSVKNAEKVCSIAPEFLTWVQQTGNRQSVGSDFVAYLSSKVPVNSKKDLANANEWFENRVHLNADKLTIYFIGSLSRSFDFDIVLKAARTGQFNLIIGGDGEQMSHLVKLAKDLTNVHLVGWVNTAQAEVIASKSDLAIAPIRALPDFEMSIPNKFFDYLQKGSPILSSLEGPSRRLLELEDVGFFYENDVEIVGIIERLRSDSTQLKKMARKCKELFDNKFSFDQVYGKLVKELELIVK